jgi:hypothetical protein
VIGSSGSGPGPIAEPAADPVERERQREQRVAAGRLVAVAGEPLVLSLVHARATTYMVDRYRHLLEGQREQDAALFDALITGARSGAHGAQRSTATR